MNRRAALFDSLRWFGHTLLVPGFDCGSVVQRRRFNLWLRPSGPLLVNIFWGEFGELLSGGGG